MLLTILIVVLVLALLGVLPMWPHAASWGYAPSGVVLLILLVVVLLALRRRGDVL
jgi:hypothetical protein